ncbi:MAG TPA: YMGG-like glycine zipper-containing protein [Opitutaceae bacterium]|nr:YMGG-like glycine zipper-containing protein [Opitutaceae bacterium]
MRTFLALALTLATCAPMEAQLFRPHLPPSIAAPKANAPAPGATRGHDFGGGFAGGRRGDYVRRDAFVYVDFAPAAYGYYDYAPYGWSDYSYSYAPSPSAAANGLWLGALAGAIIGNNSGGLHHDGWRGAAWGAGIGWLLGTAVDANRRAAVDAPATTTAPVVISSAPQATPLATSRAAAIDSAPATPMSGANALFGRN